MVGRGADADDDYGAEKNRLSGGFEVVGRTRYVRAPRHRKRLKRASLEL